MKFAHNTRDPLMTDTTGILVFGQRSDLLMGEVVHNPGMGSGNVVNLHLAEKILEVTNPVMLENAARILLDMAYFIRVRDAEFS